MTDKNTIVLFPGGRGDNVVKKIGDIKEKYGNDVYVLLTGKGITGNEPEAYRMKSILESADLIGNDKIIIEDQAMTTFENVKFSVKILDEKFGKDLYEIIIASDRLQLQRLYISFLKGYGIKTITYPVPYSGKMDKFGLFLTEPIYFILHCIDPTGDKYITPFLNRINFRGKRDS